MALFLATAAMDERYILAMVLFLSYCPAMIKKEPSESHICIYARDISVDVRIGLYASEAKPQKLLVNVALYADPAYLKNASEESIIDYKRVYDAVQEWSGRPHVKLIETYIGELLDVAFGFEQVQAARVSVTKANIFPEAEGAGVEAFMTREEYKKI
jgi:dihydroneopterin aldolase